MPDEVLELWPAGGVAVLRGEAGSGKSMQLRRIASQVAGFGGVALHGAVVANPIDQFGLGMLADALREQFERLGDPGLARHLAILERTRHERPATFSGPSNGGWPVSSSMCAAMATHCWRWMT